MLILEILMMGISILWIVMGIGKYGIWAGQAPGGGLFPVIGGGIVLVCCLADILMRVIKKQPINGEKYEGEDQYVMLGWVPRVLRPAAVVVYGFLCLLILKYLGFLPCTFLTCFIWLVFISRRTIVRSVITTVVVSAVLYSIFVLWLNIPFPKGLF